MHFSHSQLSDRPCGTVQCCWRSQVPGTAHPAPIAVSPITAWEDLWLVYLETVDENSWDKNAYLPWWKKKNIYICRYKIGRVEELKNWSWIWTIFDISLAAQQNPVTTTSPALTREHLLSSQSYKTSGNLHSLQANKEETRAILPCGAINPGHPQQNEWLSASVRVETETLTHTAQSWWRRCQGGQGCMRHSAKPSLEIRRYLPGTWDGIQALLLAAWFSLQFLFVTQSNQISTRWQVNALQHILPASHSTIAGLVARKNEGISSSAPKQGVQN